MPTTKNFSHGGQPFKAERINEYTILIEPRSGLHSLRYICYDNQRGWVVSRDMSSPVGAQFTELSSAINDACLWIKLDVESKLKRLRDMDHLAQADNFFKEITPND